MKARPFLDVAELEEAASFMEGLEDEDEEYVDVVRETAARFREVVKLAKASRKRNANGWHHIVIEIQNPQPPRGKVRGR